MNTCRLSISVVLRVVCLAVVACGLQTTGTAQTAGTNLEPRMATYDNAEGETCFSMSLGTISSDTQRPSDVMLFVDTSASQTGQYQRDSIDALEQILRGLSADDRVKVFAVDLDSLALHQDFVGPDAPEINNAISSLKQRVPLGATNMEKMLTEVAASFDDSENRNHNVIYIGDGISRAGLLNSKNYRKVLRKLVKSQVSVSSFAIGPDANVELLASLANNTGGNIFVADGEADTLANAATGLATTVHGSVFWPMTANLSESITQVVPAVCPPIRSDRDSVIFGKISSRDVVKLELGGEINGVQHDLQWSVEPEPSNVEFSFVAKLVEDAKKDGGLNLPTVGSDGVREYARVLNKSADRIASLGARAVETGDLNSARKFAELAIGINPQSRGARELALATNFPVQDNPFGDTQEDDDDIFATGKAGSDSKGGSGSKSGSATKDGSAAKAGSDSKAGSGSKDGSASKAGSGSKAGSASKADAFDNLFNANEPAPAVTPSVAVGQDAAPSDDISAPLSFGAPPSDERINQILNDAQDVGQKSIDAVNARNSVIEQKIRKQVQFEQTQAVKDLRTNPDEAINRLKNILEVVNQTPELDAGALAELQNSLQSALESARTQKLDFDAREAERTRNRAIGSSQARVAEGIVRNEERLSRLANQFASLLAERNYPSASGVADTAVELAPTVPEATLLQETTRARSNYEQTVRNRDRRRRAFMQSVFDLDTTNISFEDDRLIVFPDAEQWLERKKLREKFQNARLTGSPRDEAILEALESPTTLDYEEVPFADVKAELEERHNINIVLDTTAIDEGLDPDALVTKQLRGVRLKNGLRFLLRDFNCTYIVRDEVLRIISLENESDPENLVTDVYNVGDLVAPRFNFGGGGGFGGGGFGGGGGGFGGGGRGGGGFGGGGGGFGGGGGGGVFCIQSADVKTVSAPIVSQPKKSGSDAEPARAIVIETGDDPLVAWKEHFAAEQPSDKAVRATIRKLMREKRFDEISSVIYAALSNDQMQPWMFEALGLAMNLAGKPQAEIERAFMSVMDFAATPTDALGAAKYLIKSGMQDRGLEILEDIVAAESASVETYQLALSVANQVDNLEARKWASIGILSQEWPNHPELSRDAKYTADAVKRELAKSGDQDELQEFESELAYALQRDCMIEISYTGTADLDLYVQEPGGTVCSRLVHRTTAGGIHFGDHAAVDSTVSGTVSERYVLPQGFSGDYQLIMRRVSGEVSGGKVNVDIRQHVNTGNEIRQSKAVDVEGRGKIINFKLANGRRLDSIEDQTIKNLVEKRVEVSRSLLAQQLESSYSSSTASEYYGGLLSAAASGQELPQLQRQNGDLQPGVVGYRPEITPVQIATTLFVQHATTSDRLYVIVSLTPQFTDLTDVENFNILGGADTAGGGGGGLGGGAGGLGGGFGGQGGFGGGGVF